MVHPAILDWPEEAADEQPLALWDAESIAAATGGTVRGEFQVSGVEIDSREVGEGDLFVALKGAEMDGHRFVAGAFERGAAGALVSQPVDGPHVLVEDTQAALEALGAAARARADMKVVGITGSVGKTSTKEALFAALDRASRGAAHASVKSYNNHTGVPLSLSRTPARSAFGVFEMGMNHAGEIAALTRQVRPDVAIVTAIAPAHIENLGSEESIARAKAEIFQGLAPGGIAIIPADSPHCRTLFAMAEADGAKVVTFGLDEKADIKLLERVIMRDGGSLLTVQVHERRLCFSIGNPGRHWISNALAVIAACDALGTDLGAAGLALAELEGLPGRGARHTIAVNDGEALLIDESYNANPASMRAALAQLGETEATRRIAVLGAMKELGEHSDRFHAELADPLFEANVDRAILVGPEMHALAERLGKERSDSLGKTVQFTHCETASAARAALDEIDLAKSDAVLVKGSNSVGLAALVAGLTGGD
ncbi:UDP-N-acetylmuramoyl-tripeptide--D-alanyl-D-alanine ligase [Pseudoblastomonas halimionae]|uniref:UDP-N-acetylmuramoyl-tripeptide--D-alanyl-D-alanine ligase n=1 Tax=Alteriqipengyuania halimionae TaxID=1926630 RepID=A0A6I4U219_9SPHN|nr:UDP-N-acetylmuramoyl-tripeptide--D-alanyl-D-alanine ligase [Alteriqipengyuania halimionae]MXP10129.1 UDP-N-acetylmuramoyl-tripeptide--D-alanyl-D-alanine ligase [Alteriqipengyuania halimionae]